MRPDTVRRDLVLAVLCAVTAALAGCAAPAPTATTAAAGTSLPPDAVPRPEPRSKYGNGPVYEVFGDRYTVLDSGSGYRERGVASWYGKKFHGRLTSNREPYDMHAMTAAHKTLPLPTFVRVRNLKNDKTVIVRVNDRGPFAHNRIIDLSYAAAMKLDMVQDGTSLVEVSAITFDAPAGDRPVRAVTPSAPPPAEQPPPRNEHTVFAQIGAFGSRDNAEARLKILLDRGIGNAFVDATTTDRGELYRVRVGPIVNVEQFDVLVEELEYMGIDAPYLVTE